MESKDIYEYLIRFVSDEDVISMLSVNRKFNDPRFFHRILEKRYPFMLKYKTDDVSWRRFYVSMIYYMSKMKEDFPDDPIESFDPASLKEDYFLLLKFEAAIKYALKTNYYSFISFFIRKFENDHVETGIFRPKDFTQNMIDFIKNANFGGIDSPNHGIPVRRFLISLDSLLERRILSLGILESLFKTYVYANNLLHEFRPGYRGIKVNEELKKYFPTLKNKNMIPFKNISELIRSSEILSEETIISEEEAKILYATARLLSYVFKSTYTKYSDKQNRMQQLP